MKDAEQRVAAKEFAAYWEGRGDEKQDTQSFWMALLQKVFGIKEPEKYIAFEMPVKLSHTSFIDAYISDTRVLIEQKGIEIDLRKGQLQSDGALLSPYQQARRYAGNLPFSQTPRWIVVSNFKEFHIHDMNRPNDEPEIVALSDLEKEYSRLQFLVDTGDENIKKEMEVSLKAGELVGVLYDALLRQYKDPNDPETLKSLNALSVRLVFCLYAEDAGIFGGHGKFHNYMREHIRDARRALIDLFKVLDTKPEDRDPYMDDDLAAFPYVNGGLFADESIIIPRLDEAIVNLIVDRASADFDWSAISPTIFGAVFESTLNPETRRSGGMHYTSIENIHKVIDPLFLDELRKEFEQIASVAVDRTRDAKLRAFQQKLAGLTFLDPACGSGNFLTETYISLRRLENEVISLLQRDQLVMGEAINPIQVSIGQFYGIEINDFAVTVAKTALWIAESQMMKETEDVVHMALDFLPLKSYANIVEGNALRTDWETVVPKHELDYIMGNPPFVGYKFQNAEQKADLERVAGEFDNYGTLDYVSGWYIKAAEFLKGTRCTCAFVSTNSVSQGEHVATLWKPLFESGIHINFAHRTFRWNSEASLKAHVHCVIIGFGHGFEKPVKRIWNESNQSNIVSHINGYLLEAPDVFVSKRSKPWREETPAASKGNAAMDNGNLTITAEEREEILSREPELDELIWRHMSADDFLNGKENYCFWLHQVSPKKYGTSKELQRRLNLVQEYRSSSNRGATKKMAAYPMLFAEIRQPTTNYIMMPVVSSERRRYIPIAFLSPNIINSYASISIPNATLYHFGILCSNVHNSWMRAVGGRLKSDYRYATSLVYNTFPWPTPTEAQKAKIEQTAQAILDARALYPDCSLADLYDEVTMPPELRRAHQENDKAVMRAYGFDIKTTTEASCVAELMKMYQDLTK